MCLALTSCVYGLFVIVVMAYNLRQRKNVRRGGKRVGASAGARAVLRRAYYGGMPYVMRGIRPELKSVDVQVTTNVLSTTATFNTLNATALGTEIYERIGRRIRMKSLHLRGFLVHNGTGLPSSDDYARVIVFYDKEGTTSAIASILTSVDATGATSSTATDGLNTAELSRYKILADIPYAFGTVANAGGTLNNLSNSITDYTAEHNLNRFINLRMLQTEYGAGGAISNGGLQIMTIGVTAAASAQYSIRWYARLRYSDV